MRSCWELEALHGHLPTLPFTLPCHTGADFAPEFLKVCPFGRGFKYKKEGNALRSAECLSRLKGLAQPAPVPAITLTAGSKQSRDGFCFRLCGLGGEGHAERSESTPGSRPSRRLPSPHREGRAKLPRVSGHPGSAGQGRRKGHNEVTDLSAWGPCCFRPNDSDPPFISTPSFSPRGCTGTLQPRRRGHKAARGERARHSGRPGSCSPGARLPHPPPPPPARSGPPL